MNEQFVISISFELFRGVRNDADWDICTRFRKADSLHIIMTANATWNIWNFRRPVVEALLADGNRVTVLAPLDDAVRDLEHLGCRVRPLAMSVKGLNPLEDLKLQCRFKRIFREEQPDVVLSYTIKNNIFGAQAARSSGRAVSTKCDWTGHRISVWQATANRNRAVVPTIFQHTDDRISPKQG